MKFYITFLFTLLAVTAYSQETFKKRYYIPSIINMTGGEKIILQKEELVSYRDFTKQEIDSVKKLYNNSDKINYEVERIVSGNKVMLQEQKDVNDAFYQQQKVARITALHFSNRIIGLVKFDEDKVYVNPYLLKDSIGTFSRKGIYFFKLKNRQKIKLEFSEFSVSALTIPIKYRFKDQSRDIQEEFSTAVNVNLFTGFSWGKTSFFYQNKVGNITNVWKITGGILLGASSVKLDKSNTSSSTDPVPEDVEITKGLASVGLGLTFTFNKINIGTFYGWDYCIGKDSDKWNYNKRPWLGFALGYSLFTL